MINQGRLIKVIGTLICAMTGGALLLLRLEGKPIEPMAFSLSREIQLPAAHTTIGTEVGVEMSDWRRLEISFEPDSGQVSAQNGLIGPASARYHFVVSDGQSGSDGQIFASRRWIRQQMCIRPDNPAGAQETIQVCLIGLADRPFQSTPAQARQLETLVQSLQHHCQTDFEVVWQP